MTPKGQFLMIVPNILADQIVDEAKTAFKRDSWTILVLPSAKVAQAKVWGLFEEASTKWDKSVLLVVPLSVRSRISLGSWMT